MMNAIDQEEQDKLFNSMLEHNKLVKTVESNKNEISMLRSHISKLEGAIKDYETEVERVKQSYAEEHKKRDNLNEENKTLKEILAERDSDIEEITSKYDNLKVKLFDQMTNLGERILAVDSKITGCFSELADAQDAQTEKLAEIAKTSTEQKNIILSEISKQSESIKSVDTAVRDINLNTVVDRINIRIDEKAKCLNNGLDAVVDCFVDQFATLRQSEPAAQETEPEKPVEEEPPKEVDPEKLKGLSATAIQVYEKLAEPMTINNAIDLTGIAKATVYRHISTLLRRGLIKSLGGRPEKFRKV